MCCELPQSGKACQKLAIIFSTTFPYEYGVSGVCLCIWNYLAIFFQSHPQYHSLSNSPCMPSSPWAIIHVLSPHSYFEWNIISVKYISSSQHLIFSSLTFPFYIPNCNVDISWYIIIFLLITLLDTNKYT